MDIVLELVKIIVPAFLVFLTAYVLIRNMIRNDQEKRRQEIILQNRSTITPIRLQAYERLILFLERISIEPMIMRTNKKGMTSKQLQAALLSTIRAEFDHNVSQQIYVSPQAWNVVRSARENTIKIINSLVDKLPPNADSLSFSKMILEHVMEMDKEPTRVAIEFLKAEVAKVMG